MKKEHWITLLFGAFFSYSLYSWGVTIYQLYSTSYYHVLASTFPGMLVRQVVSFMITLTGMAALIQFYTSGFRRTQFFRAYLIFIMLSSALYILMNGVILLINPGQIGDMRTMLLMMVVATGSLIVYVFTLKTLTSRRLPQVEIKTNEDGTLVSHYLPATLTRRFLNRAFDMLLFLVVAYVNFDFLQVSFEKYLNTPHGPFVQLLLVNPMVYNVFYGTIVLLYYTLMEYFFHTTFGKTITNTTIVDVHGGFPFGRTIILRSFCRLIPADALSFFFSSGNRGWHDRLSDTAVVKETYME